MTALRGVRANASHVALFAAVLAHLWGWLGPVVQDNRGWRAFRVALSPLLPYEQFEIQPGLLLVLSVASALTNVLFVALVVWLVVRERSWKIVLWLAAGATLLNLHWPTSMGEQSRQLASGYFVWVCSFALLALAAFLARPARR